MSHSIVQAVICRLLTAKARVKSQNSTCRIYDVQNSTGIGFFFPCGVELRPSTTSSRVLRSFFRCFSGQTNRVDGSEFSSETTAVWSVWV
jgi:hypothetical protein